MEDAYGQALHEIGAALESGGFCLDCGAGEGGLFESLSRQGSLRPEQYHGIEWSADRVAKARAGGINLRQGDLNNVLPYEDDTFTCVIALSVLEHLVNGCRFLKECQRILKDGGTLVVLTPNISTYFTVALLLAGRMPSSGPHPDSRALLDSEEIFRVSPGELVADVESDNPVHRHMVVFSYRVLKKYLELIGFRRVRGRGFGLYPLPATLQGMVQRLDPWHCHQMVFVATK